MAGAGGERWRTKALKQGTGEDTETETKWGRRWCMVYNVGKCMDAVIKIKTDEEEEKPEQWEVVEY